MITQKTLFDHGKERLLLAVTPAMGWVELFIWSPLEDEDEIQGNWEPCDHLTQSEELWNSFKNNQVKVIYHYTDNQ